MSETDKPVAYQTKEGMLRMETQQFDQAWIESDTVKEVKE